MTPPKAADGLPPYFPVASGVRLMACGLCGNVVHPGLLPEHYGMHASGADVHERVRELEGPEVAGQRP